MKLMFIRARGAPATCPATIAYEGLAVHASSSTNVWVLAADYDNVDSYAVGAWGGSGYTRHDTTATRYNATWGDIWVGDSTHVWMCSGAQVKFWDGSSWSVVLSRQTSPTQGMFKALVGFSTSDLYAIFDGSGAGTAYSTGYYHWNGSAWGALVDNGAGSYAKMVINAATGPSSTVIRVAGYHGGNNFQLGTARIRTVYATVTDDYVGALKTNLFGIYAPTATTGFAVGSQNRDYTLNTCDPWMLTLSGGTWSAITPPTYGTPTTFTCVGGTSTTDVWIGVVQFAAGTVFTTAGMQMLHYDGSTFTPYTLPGFSDAGLHSWLDDVYAVSSTDVWVVGTVGCGTYDTHNYVAHWDGTQWTERGIA